MKEYVCKNCGEIKENNMQRLSDKEQKEIMKRDKAIIRIVFTVLFVTVMILWRIL